MSVNATFICFNYDRLSLCEIWGVHPNHFCNFAYIHGLGNRLVINHLEMAPGAIPQCIAGWDHLFGPISYNLHLHYIS